MRWPAAALATILLLTTGALEAQNLDEERALGPVPEGARVSLEVDRKEYLVGELVLVHFRVENAGDAPFRFARGGDYRFSFRAQGYKVSAVREDGLEAVDPEPSAKHFGGRVSRPVLAPGKRWYASLPLHRYRRIEEPGTYTVRVVHDLGWKETPDRPVPCAETTITFCLPTAEDARRIAREMQALPEYESGTVGEKDEPYPDFTSLTLPVYLPVLSEFAREGFSPALDAITEMPTAEATRLLVELLDHDDPEFVLRAALSLNLRLPDPERLGLLGPRGPFGDSALEHRQRILAASWQPELAGRVRSWAKDRLHSAEGKMQVPAAFMLQCLGEEEDLPVFIRAFDRAAVQTKGLPLNEDWWPRPRGPIVELERAAEVFVKRGFEVPLRPDSPGEAILYLAAIAHREGFRPEGWEKILSALVDHEIPWMRYWALGATPLPMPAGVRARMPARLSDPFLVVAFGACGLAGRSKDGGLVPAVSELMASTRDEDLFRGAANALFGLGAHLDRMRNLASRLDDSSVAEQALQSLAGWVEGERRSMSNWEFEPKEGERLRLRWTTFVREHGDAVRAGRRFSPGGPELTPDLFPSGFSFDFADGSRWPPGQKKR